MTSGIYQIVVKRPGRSDLFYIGQATNLERREHDHKRHLRGRRHDNRRLQALHDKYGTHAISFDVILICAPAHLTEYEQAILDLRVALLGRRVLNICRECVASAFGTKRTAETKARQSAAKKGKPGRIWTEESREKLRRSKAGTKPSDAAIQAGIKTRTGSRASPETRMLMSKAQKGRKHSAETRAKMSAARKNLSPETRAKLSAALQGNKNCLGRKYSTQSIQKMSLAALERERRARS